MNDRKPPGTPPSSPGTPPNAPGSRPSSPQGSPPRPAPVNAAANEPTTPPGTLRSPIRPTTPPAPPTNPPANAAPPRPPAPAARPESMQESPSAAMNTLRQKIETIIDDFATGKINRAQFNAMYKRYSEQRAIIERLLERNPDSDAWKQVLGVKGHTGFLRSHYEAQPMFFIVYRHGTPKAILAGGKDTPTDVEVMPVLQMVWKMPNRPKVGLGRRQFPSGNWMLLATGEHAATAVIFTLEPSAAQARLVRDLHADFERANQAALARGWIVQERMVFPQRALVETNS